MKPPTPRTSPKRCRRLIAAVAVMGLALSACASADTDETQASQSPNNTLPVDDLTLSLFGDPDEWEVKMNEVSLATAACMHDRGWTDFQQIPGSVQLVGPDKAQDYYDQNGFGVSTDIGSDVVDRGEDPNEPMIAAMDPAARSQFDQALWDPVDAQPPGCMYVGHNEVFGSMVAFTDEFTRLRQEAQEEAAADQRYLAAREEWSSCMSDAGYTANDESDLIDQLLAELRSIAAGGSPEDIPSDDPELGELQQKELQMAGAAKDCQASTGTLGVHNEVLNEKVLAKAEDCPACFS